MKSTFDQLIADTERMERRLSDNAELSRRKREDYHTTARQIAMRVLLSARPQDQDKELWHARASRVADRVTAYLVLSGGLEIHADAPPATGDLESDKAIRPMEQQVSHQDLVEWVKAGHQGIPGGKIWKREDHKRFSDAPTPEQGYKNIATIVMRAYYSHKPQANYTRLRKAIQQYLTGTTESEGEPLLDAILEAWHAHFSVRFPRDVREHTSRIVREF